MTKRVGPGSEDGQEQARVRTLVSREVVTRHKQDAAVRLILWYEAQRLCPGGKLSPSDPSVMGWSGTSVARRLRRHLNFGGRNSEPRLSLLKGHIFLSTGGEGVDVSFLPDAVCETLKAKIIGKGDDGRQLSCEEERSCVFVERHSTLRKQRAVDAGRFILWYEAQRLCRGGLLAQTDPSILGCNGSARAHRLEPYLVHTDGRQERKPRFDVEAGEIRVLTRSGWLSLNFIPAGAKAALARMIQREEVRAAHNRGTEISQTIDLNSVGRLAAMAPVTA